MVVMVMDPMVVMLMEGVIVVFLNFIVLSLFSPSASGPVQ